MNSKSGAGLKQINGVVQEACKEKIERDRRRGILNRPVRAMVVGIPNVGKSTFINSFAGKACAKTGNRPGVTKGNQWIRLNKSLELLDTPGILWPKFEDQQVGLKLALIGSVNDEILNKDELAMTEAVALQQPPSDKGKRLRLYYITQVAVKPPTFVIFVNDKELTHFSYTRYLENKIREAFGFKGTSLKFIYRERSGKEQ